MAREGTTRAMPAPCATKGVCTWIGSNALAGRCGARGASGLKRGRGESSLRLPFGPILQVQRIAMGQPREECLFCCAERFALVHAGRLQWHFH